MKKLLLLLLLVPMVSFGQKSAEIKDIGDGKYMASISSGDFSMGLSWVRKKRKKLEYKIQEYANSIGADSYTIVDVYTEPTHSGGRNGTYGALDITFLLVFPDNELTSETEISLTQYYDTSTLDPMEGIYKSAGGEYTIGIKKYDKLFKALIIDSDNPNWKIGELKAVFSNTATSGVYNIIYYMANKKKIESFGVIENTGVLSIPLGGDYKADYIKMYPSIKSRNRALKTGEWAGNGSGLIISESGYIITNHHVIDDADKIEVEFILDGEVQKFNTEIVQVDKVNDLAILKIFDINFDGLNALSYNFKTRSSDVGTKVYAYGYPMALSIMGKEIKVTDGIISAKSGYDGDITTYQISAPIQPGNSGGPLFDDKGNLVGINSSGVNKELADNVGYTIKSSYILNLLDVMPKTIELPSSKKLQSLPLTEQIKEISKYVVLVKVK
ncbi:MAG: trypsin-like peptidase domain-containing protein [Flavobacteriaceae bacterium]|nr:trypsin-like peptidase domain-containing protein [Flavobacteriaceae bacterium]